MTTIHVNSWPSWLHQNFHRLQTGQHLPVPLELGHPRHADFHRIKIAEPVGQVADWGRWIEGGSRVHVHEFSNGSMRVHLDKHNPELGLGSMLTHVVTETKIGKAAIAIGLTMLVVRVVNR